MAEQVLEGSWEEISAHATELSGKRVRLTVLDADGRKGDATAKEGRLPNDEPWSSLTGVIDSREHSPRKRGVHGEMIIEKFRRQGLKLP